MDIRSKAQLVIEDEKQAREDFLKRKERLSSEEKASDKKKLQTAQNRLAELDRLIVSVYEDKVLKKVPEEICVTLLGKYQTEKTALQAEVLTLEKKVADTAQEENDVDEFIRRLKRYTDVDELTREMCLELIEYITIDKCPGRFVKDPREVHIYYKLIDKAYDK